VLLARPRPGKRTARTNYLRVAIRETVSGPAVGGRASRRPDGIAIIGFDADKTALLQHYFDPRGTARVYRMTFADKVWTLYASAAVPEFSQRFTGTLEDDTIVGRWETSSDGTNWNLDFDLIYTRVP
jgi:hypothetical protein